MPRARPGNRLGLLVTGVHMGYMIRRERSSALHDDRHICETAIRHNHLGLSVNKTVNLIKLSVGTDNVEDLVRWQQTRRAQTADGLPRHVTRMWPKREAEILNGGSIYWVIKGLVQCRQPVLRLDEVIGEDGIRRCAIVLEPQLHRTQSVQKRPFQGWRYLSADEAPPDLPKGRENDDALPVELNQALAEIGVI